MKFIRIQHPQSTSAYEKLMNSDGEIVLLGKSNKQPGYKEFTGLSYEGKYMTKQLLNT